MNKLIIVFISFLTFWPLVTFSQSIEGLWKVTKGSTDITLEIKNNTGTVLSISSTKEFTDKIIGGKLYTNIVNIGTNKWKANRYTWRYNGTSREEQEKGWWTQVADSELSLSEDGNTLSASGHWTWKRVNPFNQEETSSSVHSVNGIPKQAPEAQPGKILSTFETDYEGVKVQYTVYLGGNGRDTSVVVKMTNTHVSHGVRIIFANSVSKIAEVSLNPGNNGTQNIVKYPFEVLVEFYPYEATEKPISKEVFDWAKKKVKASVQVRKDGVIHQTIAAGIRG